MKSRNLKGVLALVLAIMVFASMVPAMAASIQLKAGDTHTYKVYQVLTGTLSAAGETQLGNPAWGADVVEEPGTVDAFITAITASGLSDAEVAALVAEKVDVNSTSAKEITGTTKLEGLDTGYYVLIDTTTLQEYTEGTVKKIDTKSMNVVRVLNDVQLVAVKWGTTEDKKEMVSDTLGKDTAGEVHELATGTTRNDVSVGDTVNYKITAKVPSNAADYNYFYFIINDTLDAGLTFTNGSIKVYKDSISDANKLAEYVAADKTGDYIVKYSSIDADKDAMIDEEHTFEVGLVDAKSLAGKDIIVTYSAVLNENAKLGEESNDNTSTVSYSNNPNHKYNGENENPGFPDETDTNVMGETPETVTKTHTTGIEIQKVDENGNVLTGATFEISGQNTKKVLTVAETFTPDDDGNYYKLTNGTYTKTAPVDDEMIAAETGATKGWVEAEAGYTGTDAKTFGSKTYRPYKPAEDSGKSVFVLKNGSRSQYESDTQKYVKGETKTVVDATSNHKAEKAVDSNGLVRFDGLGEGTYTIKETVTPAGYNTLTDVSVTISFDVNGDPHWSTNSGDVSYDSVEGIFKITIENNKGTQLPETGGIGTTIFYVAGSIMVLAAAILLITKRRMGAED